MNPTKTENAANDTLRRLDEMVSHVKSKKEVSLEFMKSWEYEQMIREIAKEEGLAEGRAEGEVRGEARGEARGKALGKASIIRTLLESGMSVSQAAGILKMDPAEIESLLALVNI